MPPGAETPGSDDNRTGRQAFGLAPVNQKGGQQPVVGIDLDPGLDDRGPLKDLWLRLRRGQEMSGKGTIIGQEGLLPLRGILAPLLVGGSRVTIGKELGSGFNGMGG